MLTYNYTDKGHDETIVVLHGFLADHRSLNNISSTLSRTHNVLAIDLPGFGGSQLESIDVSFLDVLSRIKDVIDHLKLKKPHLYGYSMGGRVAAALICHYPMLFSSFIMESAMLGIQDESARKERFDIDVVRAKHMMNDFDGFLSEWEKKPLFESKARLDEETYLFQKRNREAIDPVGAATALFVYGTGVQPYFGDLFQQIDIPTLLIVGENDEKFVTINRAIAQKNKHTSLVVIDDAAHNVHLEQPEAFLQSVNLFLNNQRRHSDD